MPKGVNKHVGSTLATMGKADVAANSLIMNPIVGAPEAVAVDVYSFAVAIDGASK